MTTVDPPHVLVLTKPDCQPCKRTKLLFEGQGTLFDEVDITKNVGAFNRAVELGHLQAPVVIITNQHAEVLDHWSGLRPDRIKEYA